MGRGSVPIFLLFCGLAWSTAGFAAGPTLTFSPVPDTADAGDCNTAPSSNGVIERDFAGSCTPGAPCPIAATNNKDGGTTGPIDFTILGCSANVLSGDGDVDATLPGGSVQFFNNSPPDAADISVSCTPGTTTTTARVCCTVAIGNGGTTNPFWDVRCPSSGTPHYTSTPAPNSTINLAATTGGSSQATLTINNTTGTAPLIVTPGGLDPPITVTPSTQTSIVAGGSQAFTITCAPTDVGTAQDVLMVTSNDASANPASYTVNCTGNPPPAPEIDVTPAPPGPITINAVRATNGSSNLTIANTGNAPLTLAFSGLNPPLSIAAASNLAGGTNANFPVTCNAATAGTYSGTVTITSNDSNEGTLAVDVNCTVTQSIFGSTPTAPGPIALSAVQAASGTVTTTFTVSNSGDATLSIPTVTEGTAGGTITVTPTNASIAPGGNQVFTVSCSKLTAGTFNDTVTLATNDADRPGVLFNLTCDITAGAQPEFNSIPAAPGPVAISTVTSVTGSNTLTVQNVGTATLTISAITEGTPGGAITVTPTAVPINITAGSSQLFTVNCNSASTGNFNDTVTFTTNDNTGGENSVPFNLSCAVTAPSPEFDSTPAAPGPLTISTTQPTSSATTLTIRNLGTSTLTLAFSGLASPLSISAASSVAAGASKNFTVTCLGTTPGTFSQSLNVATNDSTGGEANVAFTVNCTVAPAPATFVFVTPTESSTRGTANTTALPSVPVAVGSTSSAVITFKNNAPTGGASLKVAPPRPPVPFSVSPSTTAVVAPQGTANYTVSCSPKVVGTVGTTYSFATSANNVDPALYPVTCTGTPGPEFSSTPAPSSLSISFTKTKPIPSSTSTSSTILRVFNTGASTMKVYIASGLTGDLSISPTPNIFSQLSVNAGSSADFTVSCDANIAGVFNQTLTLITNDIDESKISYGIRCTVYPPLASRRANRVFGGNPLYFINLFADGFE